MYDIIKIPWSTPEITSSVIKTASLEVNLAKPLWMVNNEVTN